MKKTRTIIKKHEKEFFPVCDCELEEYWKDLVEEKNVINENRTSTNNRHTFRNKK